MASVADVGKFSLIIEQRMVSKNITAIEAICDYCEEVGLEPELAGKLVSGVLKAKIQVEAEGLHFLPKSNTARLPF